MIALTAAGLTKDAVREALRSAQERAARARVGGRVKVLGPALHRLLASARLERPLPRREENPLE